MADRRYLWNTADTINEEMPRVLGPQTGIVYTIAGLPSGLIFNPVTHRVTGRATFVGFGEGTLTAVNSTGTSTAVLTFEWTTAGLEFAEPEAAVIWDVNEVVDYELPFVFALNPVYAITGLPAGVTWNQTDHTLEGTVTTVSTGTIVINATVGTDAARAIINWEVSAALSISVTEMQFSWDTTQWINIQMPRTRNELTGTTYSISGLPVGIVYRDSDHRLVGSPIAAGSGTGMFTATLGSETTDIPLIWNVVASPITGTPNIYAFPRDPEPRGLFNIDVDTVSQTMRIGTLPDTFSRQMSLVDHEGILYGIHDREFWRVNVNNPADSVQIATLTIHVGHHTAARSYNGLIYIYTDTASYTLNPADIVDGMLVPVNLNQNPSGDFIHDGIELNGEYYYFDLINNQRWRVWKLNPANAAHSMDMGEFPEIGVDIGVAAIGGNIYIVGERTQVFGSPRDLLWRLPDIEDPGTVVLEGALPATGTHEFHFCQNMATFTAPPQAPSFYTDSIDFAWDTILEVDYALPRLLNEPVGTTYAVSGLPAGVTFDSTNHELEGTPERLTTGTNGVGVLTATVGSDTFTINLNWEIAYILQFAEMSISLDAWPVNQPVNYMLPRALNEQMGTTYSVRGDLPLGVVFDRMDHSLEGTPRAANRFAHDSLDIQWYLNIAIAYSLPRIVNEPSGTTYAISGLPTGMSYNSINHSVEGTPMAEGTGTAILTATYQGDTTSIDLNWTVAQLLFADASVNVDWETGTAVDYMLPRVENEPANIVYTVSGLPVGVTFNSGDHTLEGTPTMAGTGTAVLTGVVGTVSAIFNIRWEVTVVGNLYFAERFVWWKINLQDLAASVQTTTSVQPGFNFVLYDDHVYSFQFNGANRIQADPFTIQEDFVTYPSISTPEGALLHNDLIYLFDASNVYTVDVASIINNAVISPVNLNIDPPWTGLVGVTAHLGLYYGLDNDGTLYRINIGTTVTFTALGILGLPTTTIDLLDRLRSGIASVGSSLYIGTRSSTSEFVLYRMNDINNLSNVMTVGTLPSSITRIYEMVTV